MCCLQLNRTFTACSFTVLAQFCDSHQHVFRTQLAAVFIEKALKPYCTLSTHQQTVDKVIHLLVNTLEH